MLTGSVIVSSLVMPRTDCHHCQHICQGSECAQAIWWKFWWAFYRSCQCRKFSLPYLPFLVFSCHWHLKENLYLIFVGSREMVNTEEVHDVEKPLHLSFRGVLFVEGILETTVKSRYKKPPIQETSRYKQQGPGPTRICTRKYISL